MFQTNEERTVEHKWPLMQPTVNKLLRQQDVSRSQWQDLFWNVHSVCLWNDNGSMRIYDLLQTDILQFINQAKTKILNNNQDLALLKSYISEWNKFFTQCDYLPKPFTQMEVNYNKTNGLITNTKNAATSTNSYNEDNLVRKLMLNSWNEIIFNVIKERLQAISMDLVYSERTGNLVDSQLVIGVRQSYVNLHRENDKILVYREHFEKQYIESTKTFYTPRTVEFMDKNGVLSYMSYAESNLKEEVDRSIRYLADEISIKLLTDTCVDIFIRTNIDCILAECPTMIKENNSQKLRLMFQLADKIENGINPMLKCLEEYIVEQALEDMIQSSRIISTDSEQYVEKLLFLFHRFSNLVKEAFLDDPRFLTARDKAYRHVVNDTSVFHTSFAYKTRSGVASKTSPESKSPELLANYCDMLLRRTTLSRKLCSDEIETKLKNLLLVLKYVRNKDVFIRYHKAHLTRRLILDNSIDSDLEENMLDWLRDIGMPADFVNKLARMFQDIKVSSDINNEFKCRNNNDTKMPDSINVKILNTAAWSRYEDKVTVTLPVQLEDYIMQIDEFYKIKHSGRKLQWHNTMSNGVITFSNAIGKFDLEVNSFQMSILFIWNHRNHEHISYEALKLATEIPDNELRRSLWSLCAFPKLKRQILLSDVELDASNPNSSISLITPQTLFYINQEFSIIKNGKPQKRAKINYIGRLQLTTSCEPKDTDDGIMHLRILRIQEAIVKIMKTRKKISNCQLHSELVEMLKMMFLPSRKTIKEQLEWLIDMKYICRDSEDINNYQYIA